MPDLDGLGFIRMLRHNSLLKDKPVVVTTMSPELAAGELAKDPHVRVLAKPVREDDLRRAIGDLLA
jgi:CheY-like chemotaxis protein